MKTRTFCLCLVATFVFSCFAVYAQAQEAIRTEEELQKEVDEQWQIAISKNLTNNREKPRVFIRKISSLAEAWDGEIVFSPRFFVPGYLSYAEQRFVVAHEIGHYLLGHVDQFVLVDLDESYRERIVRFECEASVFAAKLIEGDNLNILRVLEVEYRQTKKDKALSILLAPIFVAQDTAFSLWYRSNEFRNPLGKYTRRSWIHGPAYSRVILVLEGRIADCSCKVVAR